MPEFSFSGDYRVQSRRDTASSMLEGEWLRDKPYLLDSDTINRALRAHPQWAGGATVEMRPAVVTRRMGKFASEPDVLYKRDFFTPSPGTAPMTVDVVDVRKSCANWQARAEHTKRLFSDVSYSQIAARMEHLDVVVANEYYLHEAGHFLGYDVLAKYDDGYFFPAGKTAWPLIYLEELRADLQGFGFGAHLLPPAEAAKILLYNVALRFGVHFEGIATRGVAPYGLTPYLLFCLLREVRFVSVESSNGRPTLRLASFDTDDIIRVMRACAAHAESELTAPELSSHDPVDRAISAAKYVRRRLADTTNLEAYATVMEHTLDPGVAEP